MLGEEGHDRFDGELVALPAIETVPDLIAAALPTDMLLIIVEGWLKPVEALENAEYQLHGRRKVPQCVQPN